MYYPRHNWLPIIRAPDDQGTRTTTLIATASVTNAQNLYMFITYKDTSVT
jgi:hypothetical protein